MPSVRNRLWLPANLLLVLLVTGAQSGALAHAFEHDIGTPQYQACAICVTVSQLDTSSIDALVASALTDCCSCRPVADAVLPESLQAPVARQRGPPNAL